MLGSCGAVGRGGGFSGSALILLIGKIFFEPSVTQSIKNNAHRGVPDCVTMIATIIAIKYSVKGIPRRR